MPDFERILPIYDLNETNAECWFHADDNCIVTLEMVVILGKQFSATEFRDWLGAGAVAQLTDWAQEYWLQDGYRAA